MNIINNYATTLSLRYMNDEHCVRFPINWPLQPEDFYFCFYNATEPVYFVPRNDSSGLRPLSECASFQTDKTWLEIK